MFQMSFHSKSVIFGVQLRIWVPTSNVTTNQPVNPMAHPKGSILGLVDSSV